MTFKPPSFNFGQLFSALQQDIHIYRLIKTLRNVYF